MARQTTWRRFPLAFGTATNTQAQPLFQINEGETLTRLRIRAILNAAAGDDFLALQQPLWVYGIFAYDNAQPDQDFDVIEDANAEWLWWASMHCETYAYDFHPDGGGQLSFDRAYTVPEELDIRAQRGPAGPAGLTVWWQARPIDAAGPADVNSLLQVTGSALILDPATG